MQTWRKKVVEKNGFYCALQKNKKGALINNSKNLKFHAGGTDAEFANFHYYFILVSKFDRGLLNAYKLMYVF